MSDDYIADKQYLIKTIEKTSTDVEKLYDKMDAFKLDTSKAMAIIQTKLAIYVAFGSTAASLVVAAVIKVLGV